MLKKICLAYEGSDVSNRAFDFVIDMCQICPGGAFEVTVLSVAVPPDLADPVINVEQIVASMKARYENLLADLTKRANDKNLAIKTEVMTGEAAHEILRYLKDNNCDMVVVGQRSKGVVDEFVLGSVSRRIVRYANCATLVIR